MRCLQQVAGDAALVVFEMTRLGHVLHGVAHSRLIMTLGCPGKCEGPAIGVVGFTSCQLPNGFAPIAADGGLAGLRRHRQRIATGMRAEYIGGEGRCPITVGNQQATEVLLRDLPLIHAAQVDRAVQVGRQGLVFEAVDGR